jgi:hypothetical protein
MLFGLFIVFFAAAIHAQDAIADDQLLMMIQSFVHSHFNFGSIAEESCPFVVFALNT